jgi:hypothetical protein
MENMEHGDSVLLAFILLLACSLAATFTSYLIYYDDSRIIETRILRRGWPLYWLIESTPLWNSPPLGGRATWLYLQPTNFLADLLFWLTLFQLPSLLYAYSRKTRTTNVQTSTHQ